MDGTSTMDGWCKKHQESIPSQLTAKQTFFYRRRVHVLIWAVVTTGSVNLQAFPSVYCCVLYCSGQSVADCGTSRPSWRFFGVVLCCECARKRREWAFGNWWYMWENAAVMQNRASSSLLLSSSSSLFEFLTLQLQLGNFHLSWDI